MKTLRKKVPNWFTLTVLIVGLGIVAIVIHLHDNLKEKKEAQILQQEPDSIVSKFVKGEIKSTPKLKEYVESVSRITLSETDNPDVMHIIALQKILGTDSTANLLLERDDPKIIQTAWNTADDSLKNAIVKKVRSEKSASAAFWLFVYLPKVCIEQIQSGFYPPEITKDIIENLGQYYDFAMGNKVAKDLLSITPDSIAGQHLEIYDEYLIKNDVKRVQRIYAVMSSYDFCKYYEADNHLTSLKIGKSIFLKAHLPKANTSELNQLYGAGVLDQQTYLGKMELRPQKEVLAAYDPEIYDTKLYDRLIENVKTQEDKDALYAFFTEHKMTESVDVLLAVKK